jgi:hypothetical protein
VAIGQPGRCQLSHLVAIETGCTVDRDQEMRFGRDPLVSRTETDA